MRLVIRKLTIEEELDRREGKGAAVWGTYLNAALTIYCSRKDDLKKSFGKNISFGRVVVWCGENWKIIHFAKCPFFYSSISSNHPGAKSVVPHGIESFPSPKQ